MCKCKGGYLSKLYIYHYLKLAFRIVLFAVALVLYILSRKSGSSLPFGEAGANPIFGLYFGSSSLWEWCFVSSHQNLKL